MYSGYNDSKEHNVPDSATELTRQIQSTFAEASRKVAERADWAARVRQNWDASETKEPSQKTDDLGLTRKV